MQASSSQDRRLVPVKGAPGIYKRGSRYVIRYRDHRGVSRKRFARTLAEARTVKAEVDADLARGEYRARSKVSFAEYAQSWLDGYQGRTSRDIRPETIAEYRRDLDGDAIPYFGRMPLAAIEPRTIKEYAAHIAGRGPACRTCSRWADGDPKRRTCKTCGGKGRMPGRVSANTVRLAVAPVRALLATAFEDGLIRANPAASVRIAQRVEEEAETGAKALSEEELAALVEATPEEWRRRCCSVGG
jgi:hypothetical protein